MFFMLLRTRWLDVVIERLHSAPVVALLGARQVGKSTLARAVVARWDGETHLFDLEDPRHAARLADPLLALEPLRGLVVLDEVQHAPEIFRVLRVLADRPGTPARFMVLGSASPTLIRQTSESLAGRISHVDLPGFRLDEIEAEGTRQLWTRGAFPRSFLAESDLASALWRRDYVRTLVERDMPQLGVTVPATTLRRLWTMLAHGHGQILRKSTLARSLSVSEPTIRRYVDLFVGTYLVRLLPPWHANIGKRQVKSPKLYLTDSGIVHTLLGLEDQETLLGHPVVGASWEGFALHETLHALEAEESECFFWATHGGAELDLLWMRGGRRIGFEFKRTSTPRKTRSMWSALESLDLERLFVVVPGADTWPLAEQIQVVGIEALGAVTEELKR